MSNDSPSPLDSMFVELSKMQKNGKGLPPVHLWNPEFCHEVNMRIADDGRWFYQGSEIKRESMVKLFASVLRNDDGIYYLVTPAEKAQIEVDDVPFIIVEMEVVDQGLDSQKIVFRTNLDELVLLDKEHPLSLIASPSAEKDLDTVNIPYVLVRGELKAKVNRNVYYRLVDLAEQLENGGNTELFLLSEGEKFNLGFY